MGGSKSGKGKSIVSSSKGRDGSSSRVRAPWTKQETIRRAAPVYRERFVSSKGKGKGKDKGKGKGKGKRKGPAAFNSKFWERKLDEEERNVLSGTFTGVVAKYIFKQGWGFILPDDPESLPPRAKKALATAQEEAEAKAEEKGTELQFEKCLYFRKPDCDPEMFPLEKDTAVTFEVYLDNKGIGACNIASGEEGEADTTL